MRTSGRQYPLVTWVDVAYGDLTTAVAAALADVPAGATVVGGAIIVDTVWNSATSDVADIGDGDDPNRYTASPVDLTALGRTALTLTGYKYASGDTIDITWTGTGAAPTTGAARVEIEYLLEGRANETQT